MTISGKGLDLVLEHFSAGYIIGEHHGENSPIPRKTYDWANQAEKDLIEYITELENKMSEDISTEVIDILEWAGEQGWNSSRIKAAIRQVESWKSDSEALDEILKDR